VLLNWLKSNVNYRGGMFIGWRLGQVMLVELKSPLCPKRGQSGFERLQEFSFDFDGRVNLIKDIMLVEAYAQPGYTYEWFIFQKRDEYEDPVVILYCHTFGSQSFTVFGNCVLTREQWENIDLTIEL
jgi:hypothetical protein